MSDIEHELRALHRELRRIRQALERWQPPPEPKPKNKDRPRVWTL